MHVAVEEPVPEHLLEEDLGGAGQDPVGVEAGGEQASRSSDGMPPTRSRVSTRRAVRCQSTWGTRKPSSAANSRPAPTPPPPPGAGPSRCGSRRRRSRPRDRPQPAKAGLHALHPDGDPREEVEIAGHQPLDTRAQDLDRDLLACAGHGEVDLGDRSGCDRTVIELAEQLIEGLAECVFDRLAGERAVERRQVVLQLRQVGRHLLAEQIRARGQALAELDEAGSKVLQRERETLSWPAGASWRDNGAQGAARGRGAAGAPAETERCAGPGSARSRSAARGAAGCAA